MRYLMREEFETTALYRLQSDIRKDEVFRPRTDQHKFSSIHTCTLWAHPIVWTMSMVMKTQVGTTKYFLLTFGLISFVCVHIYHFSICFRYSISVE